MINARFAALGGAALLACAGFAHAAAGPLRAPVALAAAQPASAAMRVADSAAAEYPRGAQLLAVADVASPSARSSWTGAPGTHEPFYSNAARTDPDAPLPGALWLFGGALLAFLGISARRRF
jgi:hypothetical protein